MKDEIQNHGQSPSAILQQNKRDDARLSFIKKESSHLFCADTQIQNSQQPVRSFRTRKVVSLKYLYCILNNVRDMKTTQLFKIITSIIFYFTLSSFSPNQRSYQTECVSLETDGYVTIKIWDTKKGKSYKQEQARMDAIHAILYSGIAGANGCSTQKPILSNTEDIAKFRAIEKDFFSKNGTWSKYTRASTVETTLPVSLGKKDWKVYQVSVAKSLLHKYLEEQKIIKSLNTGF